jgi:hypothetical protein
MSLSDLKFSARKPVVTLVHHLPTQRAHRGVGACISEMMRPTSDGHELERPNPRGEL